MGCFDSDRYKKLQLREIRKRAKGYKRFYLEIGGKPYSDGHASRVLPGYRKELKAEILRELGDFEIIYCVNARDVESGKVLGRISYENQVLKDLGGLEKRGFRVRCVVLNRYKKGAKMFSHKLFTRGYEVYFHREIEGYFKDIKSVFGGFDRMEYIPVEKRFVVFMGPAGGAGKMATILNQIYHERLVLDFKKQGYAKFESFPVWNLRIDDMINLAYEAATADLGDVLMIDKLHKKAYGVEAVNYNRDIRNFEILKSILKKSGGGARPFGYRSVTDMGINMIKEAIVDKKCCEMAAKREILRRFRVYKRLVEQGKEKKATLKRMEEILKKANKSQQSLNTL